MSTQRKSKPSPAQKEAAIRLCDTDSYVPIIAQCLNEKEAKTLRPHHMANFMSLAAELFLSNYDGIATAFDRNNGLEVTFKAKLAQEKDTVEISFKPVDTYKDSASANLPDENQEEFAFAKERTPAASGVVVDAEVIPALPAPMEALPAPGPTEEENEAYDAGKFAAAAGEASGNNPHPFRSVLWHAWRRGWDDVTEPDPTLPADEDGEPRQCLEDDENLSDAGDDAGEEE